MIKTLFKPTETMQNDTSKIHRLYTVLSVILALLIFVSALGAGSGTAEHPLPTWVDNLANAFAVVTAILVLIPKTRIWGCIISAVTMLLAMSVNYMVDGPEFFFKALPYNLVTLGLAGVLIQHYWGDLPFGR